MSADLCGKWDLSREQLSLFDGFNVKITIFEGPLDLLLHLVRRSKVDISEVTIADITGQYLEYLDTLQELNVDLAAEFVVLAARLMYLKSRTLLPASDEEEDEDVELDPQVALARRLEEYRAYKEAAGVLEESREKRQRIFLRSTDADQLGSGLVHLRDVSIFDMVAAVGEMLSRAEPSRLQVLERESVTPSRRIPEVLGMLRSAADQGLLFTELVEMPASRIYIICTFLAVLELIRRGRISVAAVEGESNFRVRIRNQRQ